MSFKTKKIKTENKKKKSSWAKKFLIYMIGFISILTVLFLGFGVVNSINLFKFDLGKTIGNTIEKINVITNKNNSKGKINILLTGKGGGNHDAPNLTDSIILASLDLDKNITTMMSIPRDFYIKYGTNRYGKINEIYAVNLYKNGKKDEKKAMKALKEKITEITGQKIDYFFNVDFSGFKKVVDLLGGVEINVEKNIYDSSYPTPSGGYTVFSLKKGIQTLDGDTALKYARSRKSTSDFDRSRRQQKIISAIKSKLISEGYLSNPLKIKDLYSTVSPYFETDIDLSGILRIASDFKDLGNKNKIISFNLNNSCYYGSPECRVGGFMYDPLRADFGGASVLIPNGATRGNLGKYEKIQKFSNLIFNHPEIYINKKQINIFYTGALRQKAIKMNDELSKYGFGFPEKDSIQVNKKKKVEKTTIYYNNLKENDETLRILKEFLDGEGKFIKTDRMILSEDPNTRFEIILGNN